MSNLIIIRGLPGSGKTTLALQLLSTMEDACWFEADQYFTDSNGVYTWDGNKIGAAHSKCQENTEAALHRGQTVIVSNTFTLKRELLPYFDMIQELGKNPTVYTCQSNYGSVHTVPAATLLNMQKRFQFDIEDFYVNF